MGPYDATKSINVTLLRVKCYTFQNNFRPPRLSKVSAFPIEDDGDAETEDQDLIEDVVETFQLHHIDMNTLARLAEDIGLDMAKTSDAFRRKDVAVVRKMLKDVPENKFQKAIKDLGVDGGELQKALKEAGLCDC